MFLVVANWKLNKSLNEVKAWVSEYNNLLNSYKFKKITPVICPAFPYLYYLKEVIKGAKTGAQDISLFEKGQYTGEVSAVQIKDYCDYVIIGHSERKKYFGESRETVRAKIKICLKEGLIPIVCIENLEDINFSLKEVLVVYEPSTAISKGLGIGNPEDPNIVRGISHSIKTIEPNAKVLYGGSVSEENIESFVKQGNMNGILVGNESLNAKSFFSICKKCDILI